MGNSSKTVKSMSLGNMFAQSGTMNSREATGELSRIEFCLQPGRSTARLFEISLRTTTTPTMPSMPGRWRQMSDESFPEQVQRIVVDNAFAFVLGWLLGAGHVLSLFSDLAGAFS